MTSNWKAVLGIFLVFIFGCFAGGLSASLIIHHKIMTVLKRDPAAQVEAVEHNLTRKLNLDADQQQKVDAVFQENLKERLVLQAQVRPQMQMLNLKTFQGVKAVLRPDQAEQFHRNVAQFRQRLGQNALNTNQAEGGPSDSPVAGTPSAAKGDAAPSPAK